jgi:hypothetical protein
MVMLTIFSEAGAIGIQRGGQYGLFLLVADTSRRRVIGCQAGVVVRSVDIELSRLAIYKKGVLFIRQDDALASLRRR